MAKFPDRNSGEEESPSWLYTALGIVIILCVVGFIGLAQPSSKVALDLESESIPKFQTTEKAKVEKPAEIQKVEVAKAVQPVKIDAPTEVELPAFPADVLEEPGLFISLPFGGDARERCSANCNSETLCLQSCSRLLPTEFARRILPKEIDHKKHIADSIASCAGASFVNPITGGRRAELKTLLTPVEYYDESEVTRKISESTFAMQNLTAGQSPDPLAQAVCYYEGSLVSALATAKAVKSKDSVSEIAYREYESHFVQELQRKLQEIRG